MYDYAVAFVLSLALIKLLQSVRDWWSRHSHVRAMNGPPRTDLLFGRLHQITSSEDTAFIDRWVEEYGQVFKVPVQFGSSYIVLCDPKALAHVHANDGFTYLRLPLVKAMLRAITGPTMLSADKEDHRRQRRAIAPAFTIAALRRTTSVFYDSAYKVKAAWDALVESHDEATVDVQQWMNKITLDSIGIAGFGHDFKSLEGRRSPVEEALQALVQNESKSLRLLILRSSLTHLLLKLPLKATQITRRMRNAFAEIAEELLENSRKEKEAPENAKDRSILGLLLKGESPDTNFKLRHEEVVGQIVIYLLIFLSQSSNRARFVRVFYCLQSALEGHDTTSVSLSWALIELARHQEKQEKLRQELRNFEGDPAWDELTSGKDLPYLDAIAHEIFRLHPPVDVLRRVADKDDTIPLSSPITLSNGKVVDSIMVPKGTQLFMPHAYYNCSEAFWGPDAKSFVPERWLKENTYPSKNLLGYRHLYTFSDGPRICMGRTFALIEFKAVLSVLVRNFSFELPNGPDTKIGRHSSIVARPKVAGLDGCLLPMRVRPVEYK